MVLAITLEREGPGGIPWCPRPIAERLRRAILLRDRSLSGLARRAVRLARFLTLFAQAWDCKGLRRGIVSFSFFAARAYFGLGYASRPTRAGT